MMHPDGTVHFSDLKQFAKSPAHYRHSVEHPRETTRPMRIGSIVDMMLLTSNMPLVYQGDRRGTKAWEDFVRGARHLLREGEEIYTQPEYDDALPIVQAAIQSDIAREYLGLLPLDSKEEDLDYAASRRTQVPLKWEVNGIPRSTRGIDVLIGNRLVDLKVTNSTQPKQFRYHALKMLWHAQLADYEEACGQNGIDVSGGLFLVGIESTAPYPITVLRMTEGAIEAGKRCLAAWLEQYKACSDANVWPGYVQCVQDLDVDAVWFGDEEEDGAEDQ